MALSVKANARRSAEAAYWVFALMVFLTLMVFYFFMSTLSPFIYTYQLPSNTPGTLTSDVGSFRYVLRGLLVLWIMMPLTGLFMIWIKNSPGNGIHIGVLSVLIAWFIVTLVFNSITMAEANRAPSDPNWDAHNPADDYRWCCLYGGQPGTERRCANTAPCAALPVTAGQLTFNSNYVAQFILNIVMLGLAIFDFFFTLCLWAPRLRAWRIDERYDEEDAGGGKGSSSNTPPVSINTPFLHPRARGTYEKVDRV